MQLTIAFLNTQIGALAEGRWQGQLAMLGELGPDVVGLSEADFLATPVGVKQAEIALGMDILVGQSNTRHRTAAAWNRHTMQFAGAETEYYTGLHHGYIAVRFRIPDRPDITDPLVIAVCHLNPYSATAAAAEAQLLAGRVWRYNGFGVLIGDVNHCPVWTDRHLEEPDWSQVPPHNRSSRCLPRATGDEPLTGNQVVGQVIAQADLRDVAADWACQTGELSALSPTGHAGRLRVDQAHVTPALAPAIAGYRVLHTDHTDHDGIAVMLDTSRIDAGKRRIYA